MIITIDGKIHHLKQLDFIERQLYGLFSPEEFYKALTRYLKESPLIDLKRGYLTFEEVKGVDNFIQSYFSNFIDDARIYFLRAYVIGKLLADTDKAGTAFNVGIQQFDTLPKFIKDAVKKYNLSIEEAKAIESTVERGATLLSNTITNTQQQIKTALIESIQRGEGTTALEKRLRQMLMNETGELNRDWTRVAVSETNNAFANGYLSTLQNGEYVIGISMPDACPHCIELLDKKVYQVLKEAPPDYSEAKGDEYNRIADVWENYIWEGKNNFGRSTAPRKRIDKKRGNREENLIMRKHHELSMPVIPLHPQCRCRWIGFNPKLQYVNAKGEIKLKAENPTEHSAWFEHHISGYGEN